MELSIVSEENITPSSPTPHHLRAHLLSFLDQAVPPFYAPISLFYSVGADIGTCEVNVGDVLKRRLRLLKQSLSKTLSSFYPLAGRLNDEISIECSDEGVYFKEAYVNSALSEVLQQSEFFHNLQPGDGELITSSKKIAMVQVTRFACGGMAISALISHKIVDACSLSFFLRSWAAMARSDSKPGQTEVPDFDGSTRFPTTDALPDPTAMLPAVAIKTGRSAARRFMFDAEAIAALKAKSSSSRCKQKPSRVEVVSALLWKSIAAAVKARCGTARPICIKHAVDLRRKASPPFPESCMGNYVGQAPALLGVADEDIELSELVMKLREAITTTYHSDFVKRLQSEPTKLLDILIEMQESAVTAATVDGSNVKPEYIAFSSLCNLGFYDIDFGWGKPMWITPVLSLANTSDIYMNVVFLMDTPSKDGVEGVITLGEEDMALLEQDKEFTAFATLDQNPPSLYNNEHNTNAVHIRPFVAETVSKSPFQAKILKAVRNEIVHQYEYAPPQQPPTRFNSFEIQDRLGEQCIRMRRKFGDDEDIKIEATMFDGYGQVSKPGDDGSEIDVHLHISLLVDISKKNDGHELEFLCSAWPERLEVEKVYVLKHGGMLAEPYTGPDFRSLNGEMQNAFVEYLKVRGIDDDLSFFLHKYIMNKDRAELINWLEKLDFFLEK